MREWSTNFEGIFSSFGFGFYGGATDCGSGSRVDNESTADRSLQFFDFEGPMHTWSTQYNNCGDSELRLNGFTEFGGNFESAAGTPEDPVYWFDRWGRDGSPWRSADEDSTTQVLGRQEFEYINNDEVGYRLLTVTRSRAGGGGSRRAWGRDGVPSQYTQTEVSSGELFGETTTLYSADGTYSYATDLCPGGLLTYATLEPYTFDGLTPVSGEVEIRSGSQSVVLRFNEDGGADYQFNNGVSGTLDQFELRQASPC